MGSTSAAAPVGFLDRRPAKQINGSIGRQAGTSDVSGHGHGRVGVTPRTGPASLGLDNHKTGLVPLV